MKLKLFVCILCAFSPFLLFSEYQVKNFSYLRGNLKGIDDQLLDLHLTLYSGYVTNTNRLIKDLQSVDDKSLVYGALKRRFAWEYDGMVLHEKYFENLGGYKKPQLSSKSALYRTVVSDFGSFEKWCSNFIETGMIRGIGWVILYQEPISGELSNIWIDEHQINHIAGGTIILVMDVWEHAYITEYGLDRRGYIHAFLDNINWEIVDSRFNQRIK